MKINRITDKYNVAFENLTGETVDGTQVFKLNKEATVDVIDYLDGQDNLDDMQKALKLQDKAVAEITIIVENTEELEDIIKANEAKILDGTATPQDVMVANEALSDACALFGFDKPTVAGFEAMGDNPVESLKIANEGIGDTIANGFKAVIEWFKKFFTGIWKFIKGIFVKEEQIDKQVTENISNIKEAESNINQTEVIKVIEEIKTSALANEINNKTIVEVKEIINKESTEEVKNDTGSHKVLLSNTVNLMQALKVLGDPNDKSMKFSDLFKHFTKYVSGVTMFAEAEHFWLTGNNYNNTKILPGLLSEAMGEGKDVDSVLELIAKETKYKEPVYDLLKKEPIITAMSNFTGIEGLAKKAVEESAKKINSLGDGKHVSNVIECGAHSQFDPERNVRKDTFNIFYSWYEIKNGKISLSNDKLKFSETLDFTMGHVVIDDITNLLSNGRDINDLVSYIENVWKQIKKQSELNSKVREESFKATEKIIEQLERFVQNNDNGKFINVSSFVGTIKNASSFNLSNSNNTLVIMSNIQKITTLMEKVIRSKVSAS